MDVTLAVTIWPSGQQNWYIAGAPDSTLVLGQGGTIFVGDLVTDNTTNRMYKVKTVGSLDIPTQTYTGMAFDETILGANIGNWVGINTARPYSTVSSPSFNTSRQPNASRDVTVVAGVTVTSILVGSATVTPQVSANNSTWVSLPSVALINVAGSEKHIITFPLPASYYYRFTSSTSGVGSATSLDSVQELSN